MGRIKSLLNKHEFSLKKAKLIIGNGIDLRCGFKTSYSDYFNANDDRLGSGSLTKAFSEIYQPLAELEFYHANTWEIWDAYVNDEKFETLINKIIKKALYLGSTQDNFRTLIQDLFLRRHIAI